jgi:hypothetical protein
MAFLKTLPVPPAVPAPLKGWREKREIPEFPKKARNGKNGKRNDPPHCRWCAFLRWPGLPPASGPSAAVSDRTPETERKTEQTPFPLLEHLKCY